MWGALRLADRWSRKFAGQVKHGLIDFAAHRCMYGPFKFSKARDPAVLVVQDRAWSGAAGQPIDRLSAHTASAHQPLWLVDILRGVVDAEECGVNVLHGLRCTRFVAQVDLASAADALSYPIAIPPGISQFHELKNFPVEVWVDDDGYLRRIGHTAGAGGVSTATIDLTEFGIPLPSDWSRLPGAQSSA